MGTTDEKLDYLAQTKSDIRDAIVSKGVTVTSQDTFRTYATKIGQISGGSSFSMSMTNIVSGITSNLDTTQVLTEPGLYVLLFSTATNTGFDNGYISYSGTNGDNYNLIHSYRASNASSADTYPTIALDLVEIISSTNVTMFSYGQGDGGVSYTITKLNNVNSFGNVVNETHYRGYNQVDTVTLSSLTITTDNILVIAFGTAKYDNRNRSYVNLNTDIPNFAYNPFCSQIGETGYNDGFMLLIPKNQISSVSTYSSDDTSKCIFIVEII